MANQNTEKASRRFGCLKVLGLVASGVLVAAVATFFLAKAYLFPSEFKPVVLKTAEEKVLAAKLQRLDPMQSSTASHGSTMHQGSPAGASKTYLEPEAYTEKGLKREVVLTERELNALLAKNTDLANKLAVDLSDDLVSVKLLLPVDQSFPIVGGKVLRLNSGVEFSLKNGRPVVVLKGVSVMGIPVPNAWLGGVKNIDLVEKFGAEQGFWKTFSDGIENISVEEGLLKIKLKE